MNNCEKCELPGIYEKRAAAKRAVEVANANIVASESPTQAEPYKEAALQARNELLAANGQYSDFLKIWTGFCEHCKFGA